MEATVDWAAASETVAADTQTIKKQVGTKIGVISRYGRENTSVENTPARHWTSQDDDGLRSQRWGARRKRGAEIKPPTDHNLRPNGSKQRRRFCTQALNIAVKNNTGRKHNRQNCCGVINPVCRGFQLRTSISAAIGVMPLVVSSTLKEPASGHSLQEAVGGDGHPKQRKSQPEHFQQISQPENK